MDPLTIAMIGKSLLDYQNKSTQDEPIPMAGAKSNQQAAMLRKLQSGGNDSLGAASNIIGMGSQLGGLASSASSVPSAASPVPSEAVTGSQSDAAGSVNNSISRRSDQIGLEGPMAIEKGIKSLQNVEPSLAEKLAPVLLKARFAARGYDTGGLP